MLKFELPDGRSVPVEVTSLLNAGYAGRSRDDVAAHVAELVALGVPAPAVTPSLYPIAPYLAQQTDEVAVQHSRTSGEAEWALVVTEVGVLLTAACDHTDRALEAHGVAWSKQAGPDVLATGAWLLDEVSDTIDDLELTAWADDVIVQRGTLAELLPPSYWLDVLRAGDLLTPGTVLLSGTIPMREGVDQFSSHWRVALRDPGLGRLLECSYRVRPLPEPIG